MRRYTTKLKDVLDIQESSSKIFIKDNRLAQLRITITKREHTEELQLFSLKQTHSDDIFHLTSKNDIGGYFEGDAIVTELKYPIAVRTADCLPIFIYSDRGDFVSVVHSGWRGTAKKILEKSVNFISHKFKTSIEELNFIFGVSICHKCYQVGEDMKAQFIKDFGEEGSDLFVRDRFYLKRANIRILKKLGVKSSKIYNINRCSVCDNDSFHSFRKEQTDKRTFNIIEIV